MPIADALIKLLPYAARFIPLIIDALESDDDEKASRELENAVLANAFEAKRRQASRGV